MVEPPKACTTLIAFSKAALVMMSEVVMPCLSIPTTASPARRASASRRRSADGGVAEPGIDMPIDSATVAMVFAV